MKASSSRMFYIMNLELAFLGVSLGNFCMHNSHTIHHIAVIYSLKLGFFTHGLVLLKVNPNPDQLNNENA